MNNVKIYDINYLISSELTDDDLHYLFDTSSLKLSIIVGMFKFIKSSLSTEKIIDICTKSNEWLSKYHWTAKQRISFEKYLSLIYKNVYQYSNLISQQKAEWFIIQYGLSIK